LHYVFVPGNSSPVFLFLLYTRPSWAEPACSMARAELGTAVRARSAQQPPSPPSPSISAEPVCSNGWGRNLAPPFEHTAHGVPPFPLPLPWPRSSRHLVLIKYITVAALVAHFSTFPSAVQHSSHRLFFNHHHLSLNTKHPQ
jgi:hypothetical protein